MKAFNKTVSILLAFSLLLSLYGCSLPFKKSPPELYEYTSSELGDKIFKMPYEPQEGYRIKSYAFKGNYMLVLSENGSNGLLELFDIKYGAVSGRKRVDISISKIGFTESGFYCADDKGRSITVFDNKFGVVLNEEEKSLGSIFAVYGGRIWTLSEQEKEVQGWSYEEKIESLAISYSSYESVKFCGVNSSGAYILLCGNGDNYIYYIKNSGNEDIIDNRAEEVLVTESGYIDIKDHRFSLIESSEKSMPRYSDDEITASPVQPAPSDKLVTYTESGGKLNFSLYSFATENRVFQKSVNPAGALLESCVYDNNHAFMALKKSGETSFYFWDFSAENTASYTEKLNANSNINAYALKIYNDYGITVTFGDSALNCNLSEYAGKCEYTEKELLSYIKKLESEIKKYPKGFFRQLLEKTGADDIDILLFSEIYQKDKTKGVSAPEGFTTIVTDRIITAISINSRADDNSYGSVFAHEMYHAIEDCFRLNRNAYFSNFYKKWSDVNPSGFCYGNAYQDGSGNDYDGNVSEEYTPFTTYYSYNELYFVNNYCKTFEYEDAATICEILFSEKQLPFFFESKNLQKKCELMRGLFRDLFPCVKESYDTASSLLFVKNIDYNKAVAEY